MNIKANNTLFIGASSPIGYCYQSNNKFNYNPLPILENPMSYFLFYDNICFLNKDLCPKNMQNLDFIYFLDEQHDIENDISEVLHINNIPEIEFDFKYWKDIVIDKFGITSGVDNHARPINTSKINLTPRPNDKKNIAFDKYISKKYNMDLAINSTIERNFECISESQLGIKISEGLLSSKITSIQTFEGPWHESINDLRNDTLLKQYRKKIQEVSIECIDEFQNGIIELTNEFAKISKNIVAKHNDNNNYCHIIASALTFLTSKIPVLGDIITVKNFIENSKCKLEERNKTGWVSFISKIE